ncbi:isochorismatase family protein [Streptomyces shenzhenensis]|uniref:isochorismatase family protein n=1 Tax=Streptomyces shenzhenensis TaxID=943815 RepID=UPI003D94C93F
MPPVSSLFAAQLGLNPIEHLLQPSGALTHLTAAQQQTLTGGEFFPNLISGPFHSGLVIVFAFGATFAFLAAFASFLRGTSHAPQDAGIARDRHRRLPGTPGPARQQLRPPGPEPGNQSPSTGATIVTLRTIDSTHALVVIDLQNGTVSAHTDAATTGAVEQATRLADEFRRYGLPMVLVNVIGRAPGRTEAPRSRSGAELPSGWAGLVDELDVQPNAVTHRHSIERIFPKLGETATTAEVIEKVEAAR